ncbi:uncharacterized protein MELLADRAFT_94813 [Melampsora larici-populina 98AG31]|uniref:GAF domain-containing protein n=1 Tax=Melampsora larici-populina (strain 98AG31 / pathotype 3-4-7) TaxID=747676 RepID=F4S809_MELLP|nr:uncharacterized protein MELLADRAFT_94813 [Melampsora larici-populina 98AG31]EGF99203.1 hypothetical protein MELLADRAFT_94813 [Melampsora larici-populina 98AG31]
MSSKLLNKLKTKLQSKSSLTKPSSTAYEDYLKSYSNAEIDLENPPLPPDHHSSHPNQFFSAPLPPFESKRQRIINRLAYHQSSPDTTSDSTPITSPTNTNFSSSLSSPSTSHSHASFAYLQDLYLRPKLDSFHSSSNTTTTSTTTALDNSISKPIEHHLSFSLIDHPDLHALVEKCRALFSVAASMVSILDDDRNVYLAENGLNGITSLRRDLSFCSHTILNGDRVFAVLDTSADWRFTNSPTLEHQAARFYAGAPIFAPHFPGLIDSPPEKPVCIGTICVLDMKPRQDFTKQERESLLRFANECQLVISNWFLEKINAKIKRLDSINLSNWVTSTTSNHHQTSSIKKPDLIPISSNLVNVEEVEEVEDHQKPIPTLDRTNSSTKSIHGFPFLHPSSTSIYKSFRNRIHQSPKKPYESPSPSQMAKFDLATKILAETLELSMVYIVAVLPLPKPIDSFHSKCPSHQILVISSHNVPTPAPVLDYDLHLESIRKGPKGLIFNTTPTHHVLPSMKTNGTLKSDEFTKEEEWNEEQAFGYDRKFEKCLRERRRHKLGKENGLKKSGILLMIGEEKEMKMFRVSDEIGKGHSNVKACGNGNGISNGKLELDLKREEEIEEVIVGQGEKEREREREIKGGFVIEGYCVDPTRVLGLDDLIKKKDFIGRKQIKK